VADSPGLPAARQGARSACDQRPPGL